MVEKTFVVAERIQGGGGGPACAGFVVDGLPGEVNYGVGAGGNQSMGKGVVSAGSVAALSEDRSEIDYLSQVVGYPVASAVVEIGTGFA